MVDVLVEGKDVTRRFLQGDAEIDALHSASFVVRPGDRIALLGRSGSGKSTLLHLIADLDSPTSGEIAWPALGQHGTLRPTKVGVVFQAPSLIPTLNVVENVEVPMLLAGDIPSPRDKALAALDLVGLAALGDKLPDELSGGQAQRVALARAIAPRPSLLLADEPTGQLDRSTARRMIEALLEAIEETNIALVVATHDPSVAEEMATTWRMEHGKLVSTTAAEAA